MSSSTASVRQQGCDWKTSELLDIARGYDAPGLLQSCVIVRGQRSQGTSAASECRSPSSGQAVRIWNITECGVQGPCSRSKVKAASTVADCTTTKILSTTVSLSRVYSQHLNQRCRTTRYIKTGSIASIHYKYCSQTAIMLRLSSSSTLQLWLAPFLALYASNFYCLPSNVINAVRTVI
jgi:hypothetical protein